MSQVSKDILRDWGNDSSFRFLAAAGPKEFLNYCRHAEMIVGGSFHLAVFSILFKVPFFTYGATTYLNESMQTIYRVTPESEHLPATLPEDLDPDNIREPQSDDAGIPMPGNASGVERWLHELGILQ